jgi:hypothetical protein
VARLFLSSFVRGTATRTNAAVLLDDHGKRFYVVTDLVDACNAYYEFRSCDLPSTVLDDVKLAVEKLHEAELVHGDIRRFNIMVVKSRGKCEEEWRGLLMDYDWVGPVGEAAYPPMLTIFEEIDWAEGVAPAGEIEKKHDLC